MEPVEADPIAAFYDRRPYPPPVADLDAYRRRWDEPGRRRADHHLIWPDRPYGGELEVLVAGCGTSQAARHAVRRPHARVLGIDVSQAGLDATRDLGQRHRLGNLDLELLPIERIGELGRSFDLIICTGVLHHLRDPLEGLRALRAVLRPGGTLHLMVYARYGRTGIGMIQEYARRLGVGTSDAEIGDLASVLAEVPPGHPVAHLLREARDFRSRDALADAFLNPREATYTVPELFGLLDDGGFRFRRWQRQAPYLPSCGVIAGLPHAGRLGVLAPEEQYAAMELFRGTMARHSLFASRREDEEDPPPGAPVTPLRIPDTVLVDERLPPGAAAVLINPAHTYRDLILPVSAPERAYFEAIDGSTTVAELWTIAGLDPKRADALLTKLVQHDQVALDRSGVRNSGDPP